MFCGIDKNSRHFVKGRKSKKPSSPNLSWSLLVHGICWRWTFSVVLTIGWTEFAGAQDAKYQVKNQWIVKAESRKQLFCVWNKFQLINRFSLNKMSKLSFRWLVLNALLFQGGCKHKFFGGDTWMALWADVAPLEGSKPHLMRYFRNNWEKWTQWCLEDPGHHQ